MEIKYRLWPNGIPPRRIRMEIPGWAGEPTYQIAQPWHCKPFMDAATYGLELLYPWNAESVVTTNLDGVCSFSGDFSAERPPDHPETWKPFDSFAPNHFGMVSALDIQPEEGYGMMVLPHPRYYTDRSGTVPLAVCGFIEKDWWPHVFFLVFKAPFPGQQCVFRYREPIASVLFLPKEAAYTIAEMSSDDAQARLRQEGRVRSSWAEYSQRIFYCQSGAAFDNKYKCLSHLARTQGVAKVREAMSDPAALPYHGASPRVMDFRAEELRAVEDQQGDLPSDYQQFGYQLISGLLNDEECALYTRIVLDLKRGGFLASEENGDSQYKNSFGRGALPFFDDLMARLTPRISQTVGIPLKPSASYVRLYQRGSVLHKHLDRPELEHTMSLTLGKTVSTDWPLLAEDQHKQTISLTVPVGAGAMLSGRRLPHWREPLECADDEYVVQLFLHWS